MTLHAKVKGDELDRQHLSVNPLYVREGESTALPKHRMPGGPMMPDTAYEIVHDELMLDGNARLNLATFVTTWMESQAGKLMAECFDKNMIDKDEYPQTAELEMRCVNMLSRLWNSPSADVATGCSTTGSSEAYMLGGLALKRRWQHRRRSEGKSAERPNMVMGINVQVCWEKFCRYWDVEPRYVPMEGNRFHLNGEEAIFPENREELTALRVVIRNGFSRDLANLLLDDLARVVSQLEHQQSPAHDKPNAAFSH